MKKEFDKNLVVEKAVFDESFSFYDISESPFKLYGNCKEAENVYARMPEKIAATVSPGVSQSSQRSAGVRCRFSTNSKRIGIKASYKLCSQAVTQSALSAKGFDVYVNGEYYVSLRPQPDMENYYEQLVPIGDGDEKDIILYFPYHSVPEKIIIALDKDATVGKGKEYKHTVPVVFYGSSITQGFCVARPGNIYSSMISRKLDTDFINLGFAGVCRGEKQMAEYIGSLKKSVIVCEYDHNEPDFDSLNKKHLDFYKNLREADSTTPIIFTSSPNKRYNQEIMYPRMKVVEATYKYAIGNGDKNVYFINGQELYPEELRSECSADAVHPNDLGSHFMAEKISAIIKNLIEN